MLEFVLARGNVAVEGKGAINNALVRVLPARDEAGSVLPGRQRLQVEARGHGWDKQLLLDVEVAEEGTASGGTWQIGEYSVVRSTGCGCQATSVVGSLP